MGDKEWLERVRVAATVYGTRTNYDTAKKVDDFVRWLWQQWGYKWTYDTIDTDVTKKDERRYRDCEND